jgi:hypothetical protein
MIAVVAPAAVSATIGALAGEGMGAALIGEVVPDDGGPRYIEGPITR